MAKEYRILPALGLVAAMAFGCGRGPNVDNLAPGTTVALTRNDGGVVEGKLSRTDKDSVVVVSAGEERTVPRSDIVQVAVADDAADPAAKPKLPAAAKFRDVRVPAGTKLTVRLTSAASSDESRVEDPVSARLVDPVEADGYNVLPAGTTVTGNVTEADSGGRVKGRASLGMRFREISLADGTHYSIDADVARVAAPTKGKDAEKIGIPAAGGAVIGGLIGGGKGAAIGTLVGGGAGAATVLTTKGDQIRLPVGTEITLHLSRAIDVKLPLR